MPPWPMPVAERSEPWEPDLSIVWALPDLPSIDALPLVLLPVPTPALPPVVALPVLALVDELAEPEVDVEVEGVDADVDGVVTVAAGVVTLVDGTLAAPGGVVTVAAPRAALSAPVLCA